MAEDIESRVAVLEVKLESIEDKLSYHMTAQETILLDIRNIIRDDIAPMKEMVAKTKGAIGFITFLGGCLTVAITLFKDKIVNWFS